MPENVIQHLRQAVNEHLQARLSPEAYTRLLAEITVAGLPFRRLDDQDPKYGGLLLQLWPEAELFISHGFHLPVLRDPSLPDGTDVILEMRTSGPNHRGNPKKEPCSPN